MGSRAGVVRARSPEEGWLTPEQMAAGRRIAIKRNAAGAVRDLESGKDPLTEETRGIYAEIACALYFGVEPKKWVYAGRGGPPDDLIDTMGYSIEVKSTDCMYKPHLLERRSEDKIVCDRYICVSVDINTGHYILQGWLTGREVKENYQQRRFGDPSRAPTRAIPTDELYPMSEWGTRFRYAGDAQHLYPAIDVHLGVLVYFEGRWRRGTLRIAHGYASGCLVQVEGEKVMRGSKKNPQPVMRPFDVSDVRLNIPATSPQHLR